jgi:hypothetical protein
VEGRRHESDALIWRIMNKIIASCHNLKWCKKLHRREIYEYLFLKN